jgi:hypothetical protein
MAPSVLDFRLKILRPDGAEQVPAQRANPEDSPPRRYIETLLMEKIDW